MERRVHELLLFLATMLSFVVCVSSVTNPVTTPSTYTPSISPPSVVNIPSMPGTMPSATPVSIPSTNPSNPSSLPVTNPVTTPTTNPGTQPVSPGGLSGYVPVAPSYTTNAPAVPGQSWCVAKGGSLEIALQSALDYACGTGGVDCSVIQQGGSCYNPNSLEFHASYAFNSYYLKSPTQTSCDFGGTAILTNANPSSGSCIFPTASSSTSSPVTQNPTTAPPTPINPTPTTSSSSGTTFPGAAGTPPSGIPVSNPASGIPVSNPASGIPVSNPASGVPVSNPVSGIPGTGSASGFPITDFPYSPPGASTSISISSSLKPFISAFLLVISILTWKHINDFLDQNL